MNTMEVQPAAVLEGDDVKPVSTEDNVEEVVFSLLQEEEGLKPTKSSEVTIRNKLEEALGFEPRILKIGQAFVDVRLGREKDQKLPHRVELAKQVRDTVEEKLKEHITRDGSLRLHVRVLLVSDGASVASRRFTSGVGTAKVSLAYCLLTKEQKVALANLVYQTETCQSLDLDNYWESSSAVVRSLARSATQKIIAQITLHLVQWKNHCKENHKRLEMIEAKLAREENLDADEYAFAAEKHILWLVVLAFCLFVIEMDHYTFVYMLVWKRWVRK